ncbi:MAG: biotin--[Clostridia bacterium]|nr:biotin--[acetyl-CoA-carboxylase] ligase [Clostridia bacterium]
MKNYSSNLNPEKIIVPGKVYYKEITESTNLDAKQAENAPDKSVFVADMQTSGRGRLGRTWSSPKGCGIFMSILLKPQGNIADISQLTLIAGLAVSRVIDKTVIKWPNDVLISNKKVAGILTEMSLEQGKIKNIIVGMGINVNNKDFPDELCDKATSLYIETGKNFDREKIICDITKEFFLMYDEFVNSGFIAFKKEYSEKCTTLNKEVYIVNGEEKRIAKAIDITDKGELIVELNGKKEIINSHEVSVRGLLGYA